MRHLLLLLTLLFSISFIQAQDSNSDKDKKLDFGIRHGYSIWGIDADTDAFSTTKIYIGVFAEKEISEKLSLRLEANYYGTTLLEIPLLIRYEVSNKFAFYGGIQLDYSIADDSTVLAFRDKEFGASLILGAEYRINRNWFLDARYIHGLTNQYSIFRGLDSDALFGKKRSFNLGIRYKF